MEKNTIVQDIIFENHVLHSNYLLQLRQDMIDQKEGEIDIRVKLHFDAVVSCLVVFISSI